jgi:opacity protein-like surface antigen
MVGRAGEADTPATSFPLEKGLSLMRTNIVAALALIGFGSSAASAEIFLDGFVGKSWTNRTHLGVRVDDATAQGRPLPVDLRANISGLKPRNSMTYGARIGFWLSNFGVALDASTLNPDLKKGRVRASATADFNQDLFGKPVSIGTGSDISVNIPRLPLPTTATLAGLAMVRLPLGASEENPRGGIAPYAFAGPVWLVTNKSFDGKIGLRAGGGIRLPLGRHFAAFGEYRYTAVNGADVKAGRLRGTVAGVAVDSGDITGRLNLRNQTVVAGASLSF